MIFQKTTLRAAVETASLGRVTILYSEDGHPGYYSVIPRFNIQDIDPALGTGVHPAFVVNGVVKDHLYVGQFSASVDNGVAYSLPGRTPSFKTFDEAVVGCTALGTGFHLMTLSEMSAITLWSMKNGFLPRGNTDYGRDRLAQFESGRRNDKRAPGSTVAASAIERMTLTGSGPATWRHNNDVTGIADLVGNMDEWCAGARLVDGEIQIMADNDAAIPSGGHGAGSANWRAINAADGTLMTTGLPGSLKFDATSAGVGANVAYGAPSLAATVVNRNGTLGSADSLGYCRGAMRDLAVSGAVTDVPQILRRLTLWEPSEGSQITGDLVQVRNYGERMLSVGGNYASGAYAGLFTRQFDRLRTNNLPFRAVYTG